MTNHKFKSGSVVQLKSGGPIMTVEDVMLNKCNCVWFPQLPTHPGSTLTDHDTEWGEIHYAQFQHEALTLLRIEEPVE